jgi:predicted transcriptional regulator
VKTTLQIPDELYRQVKATAALTGRSVTSIVEESLRRFLTEQPAEAAVPQLPVSANTGGFTDAFQVSGIDFTDTSEVLTWLDKIEDRSS